MVAFLWKGVLLTWSFFAFLWGCRRMGFNVPLESQHGFVRYPRCYPGYDEDGLGGWWSTGRMSEKVAGGKKGLRRCKQYSLENKQIPS